MLGSRYYRSCLPEKSREVLFSRGGPIFEKNGTRYSAFCSWCMIQIFLQFLHIFETHDGFGVFAGNVAKFGGFPDLHRDLQSFPCKMLFVG